MEGAFGYAAVLFKYALWISCKCIAVAYPLQIIAVGIFGYTLYELGFVVVIIPKFEPDGISLVLFPFT